MTSVNNTPMTLEPSKLSRADRPTSYQLADFTKPTGREEEWRFTPMRRILPLLDQEAPVGATEVATVGPDGVTIEKVARTGDETGLVLEPGDYPAAMSWETFTSSTIVTIPANTEVAEPVYLTVQAGTELASDRIVVHAHPLSKATVVILHDGPALLNETVEVRADDGANLSVIAVHEWDRDALHTASHRVSVGRDATLHHMVVTLGGDLVRINVDTEYTGPGADLRLNGIYFVDEGQHFEHRIFVNHTQPNTISRVTYKGALQGKNARSVWIGDCLIGEDADATDTYELNRNLILTEGAKADSVPNLEIKNGEIEGAGHASATGRFDDDQLFYLMSRGVPALEARRLVIRGFFAEVLQEIKVPELEERLINAIENEIRNYPVVPKTVA